MNTLSNDHSAQAIDTDQIRVDEAPGHEAEETVTELGKISDTQGGVFGLKYDSGYGWQVY